MKKLILLAFACLSTAVLADVLPPEAADTAERFRNNPKAFDRTDVWCEGLGVGAACTIPGNAFEGGGAGKCERNIHRSEYKIDLLCALQPPPRLDRAIPEGPWQADAQWCEQAAKSEAAAQVLSAQGLVCSEPPLVSDRFCRGREAAQACEAEVSVGARTTLFKGICTRGLASRGIYYQGRRTLTRPVLSCEPEHPTQTPALKPVSAWRKLLQ